MGLKADVEALQLNIEGLLKMLGSDDPEVRDAYWQIIRGITTPRDVALVENSVRVTNNLVTQVQSSLKTLTQVAKETAGAAGGTR
jgi:hypothetical protein